MARDKRAAPGGLFVMKRLRLQNPFGGSELPFYLAGVLTIAALAAFSALPLPEPVTAALVVLVPVLTLAVCFLIAQRLTPKEKQLTASLPPPQWKPLTPTLSAMLAKEKRSDRPSVPAAAGGGLLAGFAFFLVILIASGAEPGSLLPILAAAGTVLLVFLLILLYRRRRMIWEHPGEGAVFTLIPVSQKRYLTSGDLILRIDLTVYQPNGRYVLRTKGARDGNAVAVIKYRGRITWMVVNVPQPEGIL